MPDPITIATLITVVFTGVSQLIQIYFDYRLTTKQGHNDIYKVYESNCCVTVQDSD